MARSSLPAYRLRAEQRLSAPDGAGRGRDAGRQDRRASVIGALASSAFGFGSVMGSCFCPRSARWARRMLAVEGEADHAKRRACVIARGKQHQALVRPSPHPRPWRDPCSKHLADQRCGLGSDYAAAPQRNGASSRHIRCITTASFRATAILAFLRLLRLASLRPQARIEVHCRERVSMT